MKNPGIAAVLSFFYCGLGQIYNGQILKGIIMFACYSVSLLLIYIMIGFITTPVLWIWGIYDAYKTADKITK